MKKLLLLVICVILLSGCSALDSVSNEIVDQISNVVQSTDKYVMTIQNANMNGTTYTYKDVFSNFFAYPTWKHFTSNDGQEVVEFTGECTYDNQNVKAKIQFVITSETEDYLEWETTYLSFNNVSQPLIMLSALLEKAVEEYDNKTSNEIEIKNNELNKSNNGKENQEKISQEEQKKNEYINELKSRIVEIDNIISKRSMDISNYKNGIVECEREIQEATNRIVEFEQELNQLQNTVENLGDAAPDNIRNRIGDLKRYIENNQWQINMRNQDLERLRNEYNTSRISNYEKEIAQLETEKKEITKKLKENNAY